MAKIELVLPVMGEGIIEATITKWLVDEGETVAEEQPLVEIATDKVDTELPAPVNGIVSKIIMAEGEVPEVGDILAEIESEAEAEDPEQTEYMPRQTPSGKFLTPLVRSIAKKENISIKDLDTIRGSGDGDRITKEDILAWLDKRKQDKTVAGAGDKAGAREKEEAGIETGTGVRAEAEKEAEKAIHDIVQESPFPGNRIETGKPAEFEEGDKRIEMDRRRKLTAHHMVRSKQTSPHVTSFIDVDVTGLAGWREATKNEFQKRENQKITYTPVFIEAAARALRDYPMVNISVDGTTIVMKKNVNIGIAVALPDGNLIVPVIKNADEKNLTGLINAVNDLAHRARINKLKPDETSGGTFTISNFGTFKNTTGTPIINQPEVAILGTGAIVKKPVVLETSTGDVIAIRHIMTLSLSFDHRVVDGTLGGMFLKRVAEYLENFDTGQKI